MADDFCLLKFSVRRAVALKNRLSLFRRKTMAYTKPQVIAQNASTGSYAAGCPANDNGTSTRCRDCERTE